jgi:hypothetical protein
MSACRDPMTTRPGSRSITLALLWVMGLPLLFLAFLLSPALPHAIDQYLPFFQNASLARPSEVATFYFSVWKTLMFTLGMGLVLFGAIVMQRKQARTGMAILAGVFAIAGILYFGVQFGRAVVAHLVPASIAPEITVDRHDLRCSDWGTPLALGDIQALAARRGTKGSSVILIELDAAAAARRGTKKLSCPASLLDATATDIVAEIERRRIGGP